jgi:hypothetical protein
MNNSMYYLGGSKFGSSGIEGILRAILWPPVGMGLLSSPHLDRRSVFVKYQLSQTARSQELALNLMPFHPVPNGIKLSVSN